MEVPKQTSEKQLNEIEKLVKGKQTSERQIKGNKLLNV
jgi:hypothetical protein